MKNLQVYSDTTKQEFICLCSNGHKFAAELAVVVNVSTDADLLKSINDDGSRTIICPVCNSSINIYEYLVIHDEKNSRVSLYIPQGISHRMLDIKAAFSLAIAEKQGAVPVYFSDFDVVTDFNVPVDIDTELSHDKSLEARGKLHGAFADLASIIPKPPDDA
jgi:hypothetical protein